MSMDAKSSAKDSGDFHLSHLWNAPSPSASTDNTSKWVEYPNGEPKDATKDKTGSGANFWFWASEAYTTYAPGQGETPATDRVTAPVDKVDVRDLPATKSADEQVQELILKSPDMSAATFINVLKASGLQIVDTKPVAEATSATSNPAVQRECSFKEYAHKLRETTAKGVGPTRFKVALIQEGLGNLRDGFYYTKHALEGAISEFEGKKCYADHPSREDDINRPERSVRDIIGHFESVRCEENEDGSLALCGDLVMPPDPAFEWARSLVRGAAEYAKKYPTQELVGLSINASGDAQEMSIDEFFATNEIPDSAKPKIMKANEGGLKTIRVVNQITEAVSCDLVTEPGAKGKVLAILENNKEI